MNNQLKNIVTKQKNGEAVGIYSCCSANENVLRAALQAAKDGNYPLLIESTANQVDQNGGYTGMKPKDFKDFVLRLASEVQIDPNQVYLGGDHLGPLTVTSLPEVEAMAYAEKLVHDYVEAGFTKIHLDTSMKVADDDPNTRLSDETIARRGARLARVCNEAYKERLKLYPNSVRPVYVIGSEVPIPGGAQSASDEMQVTRPEDFKATYQKFHEAFLENGLEEIWDDVIAIVVQPGVEEKDAGCTEYDREKARELTAAIREPEFEKLIFEGHSTDYQTKYKLRELVEDGIGILKVGPGLTFANREAIYALANIEKEDLNIPEEEKSHFIEALDEAMVEDEKYWAKHYHGNETQRRFKRKYSFSDRSRYYIGQSKVQAELDKLVMNLNYYGINLALLSQFMPIQYTKVREGKLANKPEALIQDRIRNTIDEYTFATQQRLL